MMADFRHKSIRGTVPEKPLPVFFINYPANSVVKSQFKSVIVFYGNLGDFNHFFLNSF